MLLDKLVLITVIAICTETGIEKYFYQQFGQEFKIKSTLSIKLQGIPMFYLLHF